MDEEQTQAVPEEFATPATEDIAQASEAFGMPEETQEVNDQERNWKAVRERSEQLQREKELVEQEKERIRLEALQAQAEAKALREMYERQTQQTAIPQEEPEPEFDPEELTTLGDAERILGPRFEKRAMDRFEKRLAEMEQERYQRELPNKIRSSMPDFETVVSDEKVKQLEALEPEVAEALGAISDPYKKAVAVYKYLKKSIPQETPKEAQAKEQIRKNAERPQSLSSVGGGSPLSQAGMFDKGMTPELQAYLRREMAECSKQA